MNEWVCAEGTSILLLNVNHSKDIVDSCRVLRAKYIYL